MSRDVEIGRSDAGKGFSASGSPKILSYAFISLPKRYEYFALVKYRFSHDDSKSYCILNEIDLSNASTIDTPMLLK